MGAGQMAHSKRANAVVYWGKLEETHHSLTVTMIFKSYRELSTTQMARHEMRAAAAVAAQSTQAEWPPPERPMQPGPAPTPRTPLPEEAQAKAAATEPPNAKAEDTVRITLEVQA